MTVPTLTRLGDLLEEWQEDAEAAYAARQEGKPRGPVTGLKKTDDQLGGAFSPGVHVIHGTPGSGKTALCLQISTSCQCPAILLTCEMAPLELLRRLTARLTGTFLGRLRSGELEPEQSLCLA